MTLCWGCVKNEVESFAVDCGVRIFVLTGWLFLVEVNKNQDNTVLNIR